METLIKSLKIEVVPGATYICKSNSIRRILGGFVSDKIVWDMNQLVYELLSEEPLNNGRRIGYTKDGNPFFQCSLKAFQNAVVKFSDEDILQKSISSVPTQFLGKAFLCRDGEKRRLLAINGYYLMEWFDREKEDWANGQFKRIVRPWEGAEIVLESTPEHSVNEFIAE